MTEAWRSESWRHSVKTAAPKKEKSVNRGAVPSNGAVSLQRNIGNEQYDRSNLKPLTRALWSLSVALAHLIDCYDRFSKIKSVKVSPDGMLGGRGYIKTIPQIRQEIAEAQEMVSSLVDTLHDEVNAPHWREIKDELEPEDIAQIDEMVSDSQKLLDTPGAAVDEQYDNEVTKEATRLEHRDAPHESLPTDESDPQRAPFGILPKDSNQSRFSNSNDIHYRGDLGGPRIDALGPGAGQGPYGTYNKDEDELPGGEYPKPVLVNDDEYPNPWEGDYSSIYTTDLSAHEVRSSLPGEDQFYVPFEQEDEPVRRLTSSLDESWARVAESWSLTDPEPNRDADDFGLGFGVKGDGLDDSVEQLTWWDDFVGPSGVE